MSENFLIDINPEIELPTYTLVLHKPNGEPLAELFNIEEFEIKKYFVNIDEINFQIPFYINDNDGSQVENELFNLVHNGMTIRLNDMQDFTVIKSEIDSNVQTGEISKSIMCYSLEYTLSNKLINGYEGVSRKLYDYAIPPQKDENGLFLGFLNYIESKCSWKIGYISSNLLSKYRSLSFPKSNFLQAMIEAQKTFGCIFQYDTLKKEINVYEENQLGKSQNLYISDGNFIKNLNQTIDQNEVVTRLYLYGKNNISIQPLNTLGKPYIENYSYFKNLRFMSQDLIDALNNYENYIQTKQGLFEGYLTELNTKNVLMGTKLDELTALLTQLKVIQTNLDIAISSNQPTTDLKAQESAKLSEITTKQNEIDSLQDEIDIVNNNINQIAVDTDMTTHFTEAQLRELDPFIREDEYSDSNYTEDNLQELLDEGKKILGKISYPNLTFNVDVEDFLSLVEGQHMWSNFILGDLVTVEHEELGFNYEVRLVGYTHNPDSNKLNLTFSNRNSVDDPNIELKDILEGLTTTTNTVDFSRFKWDKGENANSLISNYINNNLDLTKQKLIKAEGQKPIFDDRGYWGYKVNPDGSIDDKQLRMTNEVIAMTQDNWNNIEVAISPTLGINATLLNGKISNLATINAEQINVGGTDQPLLEYIDDQTDAVTVHQIVLSNENQSILTDSVGKTTIAQTISTNIDVYRGITKVDGTIGTPLLKNSSGATITFGTITPTNPTAIASGNIIWTIPINTTLPTDSGWIEIPLTIETKPYIKKLFWSKAKEGQQGSAGASAKLVTVAPSHSSFISQSTANPIPASSYTPATLTLTPNFQSCEYSKWQYSLDGSVWTDVASGSNGLTITGNVLSITNTSALYTTSQTFLIFKVLSTTGEYDLVTIPRIYDSTTLAQNALKQNFYYNRTKITEEEGIEVYDNLNRKVLQTGSFDSDGNGTKDMYGHVAYHADGSYSALVRDGFLRKNQYGESFYLNDMVVLSGATILQEVGGVTDPSLKPLTVRIPLPQRFRNKTISYILSMSDYLIYPSLRGGDDIPGDFAYARIRTFLQVVGYSTTVSNPYIDVDGYTFHTPWGGGGTNSYGSIGFTLTVLAN